MSSMNNVKKRIIISMFAIILLILTLFGITYAYFSAKIKENENSESIKISAARMELSYDGKDSYVKITNLQPGEKIAEKKFSVTNEGTRKVENYDVILENLVNELTMYEDLTYTLTCESSDGNECKGSNGVFPKTNQVIVTNTIESEATHNYILKLTYAETGKNQSIDMNKKISAKVNIKHDVSNIKTLKIYGNSVQSETSTLDSLVEIESLGNLVSEENNENYNKYQIPIKVVGKNLINVDIENASFTNSNYASYTIDNQTLTTTGNVLGGFLVKVESSQTYSYKIFRDSRSNNDQIRIYEFSSKPSAMSTSDPSYIKHTQYSAGQLTNFEIVNYTVSDNTKYVICGLYMTRSGVNMQFQFEKSSASTQYEPYEEKIFNVYLDEPLRKLGDVSDYIDLENRIVVRNIGEKVFDGTENILGYENGIYYGLLHNPKVTGTSNYFSSNSENIPYLKTDVNENAIHFVTDNTVEEFKSFLTTNYNNNKPLKVLYGLNKTTFDSIDVPIFDVDSTKNISVCSNNNVCSSNIEVEYDE